MPTVKKAHIKYALKTAATRAVNQIYWADRFHEGDRFTVNGRSVEIDADGGGGHVADLVVNTSAGASVADDLIAIAAGIQGDAAFVCNAYARPAGAETGLFLVAKTAGVAGNAYTLVEDVDGGAHGTIGGATFTDGADAAVKQVSRIVHTVTSAEQLAQAVYLRWGITAASCFIGYRAATGVLVSNYVAVYTASDVLITPGATAFVAGDIITLEVTD